MAFNNNADLGPAQSIVRRRNWIFILVLAVALSASLWMLNERPASAHTTNVSWAVDANCDVTFYAGNYHNPAFEPPAANLHGGIIVDGTTYNFTDNISNATFNTTFAALPAPKGTTGSATGDTIWRWQTVTVSGLAAGSHSVTTTNTSIFERPYPGFWPKNINLVLPACATVDPINADANGLYTIDEGDPVTLDASASAGTSLVYRWDVDGDSDFDENVTGVNPTVSAATLLALGPGDGLTTSNVTVEVTEQFLFWDFENATSVGDVATSVGLATGPDVTGFASQTGGGPASDFDGSPGVNLVLLTRPLRADNLAGPHRPFIEFTTAVPIQLEGLEFQHFHNHNPGFPTFEGYDVQLQIDTGAGFTDIGAPLTINNGNQGTTSTMSLGSVIVPPGTHQIRWDARNLLGGATNTGTEFFALNDMTLFGRTALSGPALLTVNNVAPSNVTLTAVSDDINENDTATVNGTFTDPGVLATHTVVIDWGDGNIEPLPTVAAGVLSFSASHQYLDDDPTNTPADDYVVKVQSLTDTTAAAPGSAAISSSPATTPTSTPRASQEPRTCLTRG